MAVLGSSLLGASTFCAKQHGADECDAKGLPLTLSTTNIIGRFQYLKGLRHPHLAVYLDAKKLKNGTSSGAQAVAEGVFSWEQWQCQLPMGTGTSYFCGMLI